MTLFHVSVSTVPTASSLLATALGPQIPSESNPGWFLENIGVRGVDQWWSACLRFDPPTTTHLQSTNQTL